MTQDGYHVVGEVFWKLPKYTPAMADDRESGEIVHI